MPAALTVDEAIARVPKAELHIHIEGSLEPELLFHLSQRNSITIPYASVEEIRSAYNFTDLQSFLDVYYCGAKVLVQEQDFEDLAFAYMVRAHADNVRHAEIMFDPQTHTARGIAFVTVLNGLEKGFARGLAEFGITTSLIMSFLRHLSEEECFLTLAEATPYLARIGAVGLDSSERGNPPEKFERLFAKCAELGLMRVAHAGEEGSANSIRDAISKLGIFRVDHGVACTQDDALVADLVATKMPLTVCPRSNVSLKVFPDFKSANTIAMLRRGVHVTINSDDPAYFGGYLNSNFEVLKELGVTVEEVVALAKNSFTASNISAARKAELCAAVDQSVA